MRYLIGHVLEGIAAHRQNQIQQLTDSYIADSQEIKDLYRQAEEGTERIISQLRSYADEISGEGWVFLEDLRRLRDWLWDRETKIPRRGTVRAKEGRLDEKNSQIIRLKEAQDTKDSNLEVFLRAIQEGGETHVSQHGLKQAGFKDQNVATFIAARARAVKDA